MTRGPRMRRRAVGTVLAAAAVGTPVLALAPAAHAQAQQPAQAGRTGTATVADAVEAWFSSSPIGVCTTPVGCPPAPAPTSPYPADTLHVGVAGGQETARTYLLPDLAALPVDAIPDGGTMTLPVATGTADGTAGAASAAMKACLATATIPAGAGSSATPPSISCATSSRPAYDAKSNTFTLDLTPFLRAWRSGAPRDGLALVPDVAAAGPTDAWQVTFNARTRAATPHISSRVTYLVTAPMTALAPVTPSPAPAAPPVAAPPPAPVDIPAAPAPAAAALPAPAAPPVVAAPAPAAAPVAAVALSSGFQYPMAFLMPLALLAGAVFLVRLFTRDATPRKASTSAVAK